MEITELEGGRRGEARRGEKDKGAKRTKGGKRRRDYSRECGRRKEKKAR